MMQLWMIWTFLKKGFDGLRKVLCIQTFYSAEKFSVVAFKGMCLSVILLLGAMWDFLKRLHNDSWYLLFHNGFHELWICLKSKSYHDKSY